MKFMNPKKWGITAVGASLFATIALFPQARAELVYENDAAASQPQAARVEERMVMRDAIGASEKMQNTLQDEAPMAHVQVGPPQVIAQAPVAETQSYTKAELLRRERQREELKNEDVLQQRLEELRLRDEQRRTEQLMGVMPQAKEQPVAQAPAPVQEVVVSPGLKVASNDSMVVSQSMATSIASESSEEKTMISVSPRGGLSNMVNTGFFDVRPHFAAGVGASVSASENISFELGYTFNEYGVAMASNNPYVVARQMQATMYGNPSSSQNFESLTMKQNVIDAGLKVHLLGTDSKIRPFLGAGGAYSLGYINFSSQIQNAMGAYSQLSPDYKVNSFMGFLSTGVDVKVAKNLSVGLEFKYHAVLTARESTDFSNYYGAMYQPGYYTGGLMYGLGGMQNSDPVVAGGTLARASFYSILGGVNFTF